MLPIKQKSKANEIKKKHREQQQTRKLKSVLLTEQSTLDCKSR